MSNPIMIVLTSAGLDALVNAQNGTTANIQITQLALTQQAFFPAPTLTALPGEFKRIGTFSGQSVSETMIHMSAQDSDPEMYDLRGFGLFLDDGTLFATYGQNDPILTKTGIGTFLFSVDIAFSDAMAGSIDFGDASFLFPPATEAVKGVAKIASQEDVNAGVKDDLIVTPKKLASVIAAIAGGFSSATEEVQGLIELANQMEVNAGTDDSRAVTPLKLAIYLAAQLTPIMQLITTETASRQNDNSALLAAINGEITNRSGGDIILQNLIDGLRAISITGTGLVTGGGTLTANRQLQVLAASGAEAKAEALGSKALTPASLAGFARQVGQNGYATIPGTGGLIIQHGRFTSPTNSATNILWPIAFPTACYAAVCDGAVNSISAQDNYVSFRIETVSRTGATAYNGQSSHQASYLAIGR